MWTLVRQAGGWASHGGCPDTACRGKYRRSYFAFFLPPAFGAGVLLVARAGPLSGGRDWCQARTALVRRATISGFCSATLADSMRFQGIAKLLAFRRLGQFRQGFYQLLLRIQHVGKFFKEQLVEFVVHRDKLFSGFWVDQFVPTAIPHGRPCLNGVISSLHLRTMLPCLRLWRVNGCRTGTDPHKSLRSETDPGSNTFPGRPFCSRRK